MPRSYKYLYMDVALPGDLFAGESDPATLTDLFASQAIDEARERMKTYAVPAEWTARIISGTIGESYEVVFRVCRKSGV